MSSAILFAFTSILLPPYRVTNELPIRRKEKEKKKKKDEKKKKKKHDER